MSKNKSCNCLAYALVAAAGAGVYYLLTNYDMKLFKKKNEEPIVTVHVDGGKSPEYLDISGVYMTDYEAESFDDSAAAVVTEAELADNENEIAVDMPVEVTEEWKETSNILPETVSEEEMKAMAEEISADRNQKSEEISEENDAKSDDEAELPEDIHYQKL